MKEIDIVSSILQYLWYNHIFAWRNNTGAFKTERGGFYRFGHPGSGDIFAIEPRTGRFISIEVKQRGKKPTEEQEEFMEKINRQGGIAFVAYSIDDVKLNLLI